MWDTSDQGDQKQKGGSALKGRGEKRCVRSR